MNNKMLFLTVLFLSNLLHAISCPQEVPLAGLSKDQISDYRNKCGMQIDFDSMTLKPSWSVTVEAGQIAARAPGINSVGTYY